MGVNVHIETIDYREHPDWDWMRQSGDRIFWDVNNPEDFETWTPKGYPHEDDRCLYRPKDFSKFRAVAWPDEYARERYARAADILEANPDYWLYFSW